MKRPTTTQAERYLQAIYRCAETTGLASANDVARQLGVTSPAVSGMFKRLAEQGLLTYRPYRRVSLTDAGKQIAQGLVRRHRLAERLLTDVIGLPWESAHGEACRLEHSISAEVEARLEELVGQTATCPHGHPLDPSTADDSMPLTKVEPPRWAQVVKLLDESPEVIRYLEEAGLVPGASVHAVGREPFGGPITVETTKGSRPIGRELAQKVWVRPHGPLGRQEQVPDEHKIEGQPGHQHPRAERALLGAASAGEQEHEQSGEEGDGNGHQGGGAVGPGVGEIPLRGENPEGHGEG